MERYCPECFGLYDATVDFCPEDGTPLRSRTESEMVGKVLDGRYRILSRVGAGGMGVVYRAEQTYLKRIVALKVLRNDGPQDPAFRKRFLNEARAIAALTNRNTITIFDFGATPDGVLYYTMELLDGRPLSAVIADEGPLQVGRAVGFVEQVCESLEEAHEHGILHRDIKPDNIFVRRDKRGAEEIKVLDFGIAKLLGDGGNSTITQAGMIVGTPRYLSPEQAIGESAVPASDLYSLAVVLFEMLAGLPPFRGETPLGTLWAHMKEPVPSVAAVNPGVSISPELQAFLMRALAKEPNRRFKSAAEFREALRSAAALTPTDLRTAKLPTLAHELMHGAAGAKTAGFEQEGLDLPTVGIEDAAMLGPQPAGPVLDADVGPSRLNKQERGSSPEEDEYLETAVLPTGPQPVAVDSPVGERTTRTETIAVAQWPGTASAAVLTSHDVPVSGGFASVQNAGADGLTEPRSRRPLGLYVLLASGAVLAITLTLLWAPWIQKADSSTGSNVRDLAGAHNPEEAYQPPESPAAGTTRGEESPSTPVVLQPQAVTNGDPAAIPAAPLPTDSADKVPEQNAATGESPKPLDKQDHIVHAGKLEPNAGPSIRGDSENSERPRKAAPESAPNIVAGVNAGTPGPDAGQPTGSRQIAPSGESATKKAAQDSPSKRAAEAKPLGKTFPKHPEVTPAAVKAEAAGQSTSQQPAKVPDKASEGEGIGDLRFKPDEKGNAGGEGEEKKALEELKF